MKKLKKILTSMLALALIFVGAISLGGCGSKKGDSNAPDALGMTFSYVTYDGEEGVGSGLSYYFEISVNNPTNEDIVIYQNNFNLETCYEFMNEKIYYNYSTRDIYTTYTKKTSLSDSYGNKIDNSLQINSNTQQTLYVHFARVSKSITISSREPTTSYHLKSITISYLGDVIIKDLPMGD